MTKGPGLGDNLYLSGFDVSGDIGSLGKISGSMSTQDVTPINLLGYERIGLLHDGGIDYSAFWNPTGIHPRLKLLPYTDDVVTYCRGTLVGSHAASLLSKQINYDGTRGADGSLTFAVSAVGNAYGIEWGQLLTAGKRTDTTAGNGPTLDLGSTPASYSFGWGAYLHVFAITGTSVTITLQDSADGVTFANLTGGAFSAMPALGTQRLASASTTATVRRYVRIVSSGTFTNAVYAVNFARYESTGHA